MSTEELIFRRIRSLFLTSGVDVHAVGVEIVGPKSVEEVDDPVGALGGDELLVGGFDALCQLWRSTDDGGNEREDRRGVACLGLVRERLKRHNHLFRGRTAVEIIRSKGKQHDVELELQRRGQQRTSLQNPAPPRHGIGRPAIDDLPFWMARLKTLAPRGNVGLEVAVGVGVPEADDPQHAIAITVDSATTERSPRPECDDQHGQPLHANSSR